MRDSVTVSSDTVTITDNAGGTYVLNSSTARSIHLPKNAESGTKVTVIEASNTSYSVSVFSRPPDSFSDGSVKFLFNDPLSSYTFVFENSIWYVV